MMIEAFFWLIEKKRSVGFREYLSVNEALDLELPRRSGDYLEISFVLVGTVQDCLNLTTVCNADVVGVGAIEWRTAVALFRTQIDPFLSKTFILQRDW